MRSSVSIMLIRLASIGCLLWCSLTVALAATEPLPSPLFVQSLSESIDRMDPREVPQENIPLAVQVHAIPAGVQDTVMACVYQLLCATGNPDTLAELGVVTGELRRRSGCTGDYYDCIRILHQRAGSVCLVWQWIKCDLVDLLPLPSFGYDGGSCACDSMATMQGQATCYSSTCMFSPTCTNMPSCPGYIIATMGCSFVSCSPYPTCNDANTCPPNMTCMPLGTVCGATCVSVNTCPRHPTCVESNTCAANLTCSGETCPGVSTCDQTCIGQVTCATATCPGVSTCDQTCTALATCPPNETCVGVATCVAETCPGVNTCDQTCTGQATMGCPAPTCYIYGTCGNPTCPPNNTCNYLPTCAPNSTCEGVATCVQTCASVSTCDQTCTGQATCAPTCDGGISCVMAPTCQIQTCPSQSTCTGHATCSGETCNIATCTGLATCSSVPGCSLCSCPHQGDLNGNGSLDIGDLLGLIGRVYLGDRRARQDPTCPHSDRADLSCDGQHTIIDIVLWVDCVWRKMPNAICDPCTHSGSH